MVSDRQNGFETVVAPDPSTYQKALFDAGRLLQEGNLQACVEMLMPFASPDSAAIRHNRRSPGASADGSY